MDERKRRRRNVMVKGIEMKGEGIEEGELRKIWDGKSWDGCKD